MRSVPAARPMMVLALVLIVCGVFAGIALGHERRDVGSFQFVVGFFTEPAYESVPNAVDLRVSKVSGTSTVPVEGVEATLRVEVTHVATGKSRIQDLKTVFRDLGHYRSDLIPTASGQFRFRFFGTIDDLQVNETFESGPGRFNNITAQSELQFPEPVAAAREIQSAARGANATANEALDKASSASALGIVGIVLGAVGVTAGMASIGIALRRRGK